MTSTSELDVDQSFMAKKWSGGGLKKGNPSFKPGRMKNERRTCYKYDQSGHFSNSCLYEKRKDKPSIRREMQSPS
jgi:hypothetical protein